MKHIFLPILLLVTALLASCSSDSFKIDGDIANLDGHIVRVMFRGDSGVVDQLATMDKKGHFSVQGVASQPVIVNLMDSHNNSLVMLVAVNGDHLKVKGDAADQSSITVKGSHLNDEWQIFRKEHADFYKAADPGRLDAAIEKYVREHPDDMLSTVLLMADYSDYSDRSRVGKLLGSISGGMRPQSLTQAFPDKSMGNKKSVLPRLTALTLVKHGGQFEEIKLDGRVTLISMWANPQENRNAMVSKLQAMDGDIHILDILTESDTLRWHKTIADDPSNWQHYWAPGGPLEQGVQLLGLTSLPWFAVTDSTGMVTYSGPDFNAARDKALNLLRSVK